MARLDCSHTRDHLSCFCFSNGMNSCISFLVLKPCLCSDTGGHAEKFVMDPPQRQEALLGDPPGLLTMDPNAANVPDSLELFPDDDSSEKILPGLFISAEAPPPGNAHPPPSSRGQPVRPPPPQPKSRLLGACLPDAQGLGPPPVPPRSRVPLSKALFSLDLPEPPPRLTRSWTEVKRHVSNS